jgi:DNA polymerase-1
MLIFDTETDGLLDQVTRVHVLVIRNTKDGTVSVFRKENVADGVHLLMRWAADGGKLVGHNAIKFDVPVLKKLYPWFSVGPESLIDTMVLARVTYPDLTTIDTKLKLRGQLPGRLFKSHSLEAWGRRLNCHKGDYTGGWAAWSQEMEDYCVQDTAVTAALLERCMTARTAPPQDCIDLEMRVAWIVARQERHGFAFDEEGARRLYLDLAKKRVELRGKLSAMFPPFYVAKKSFTPKRDDRKHGYTAGAQFVKVELTVFNPASRAHIANRLKRLYGWEPTEFTDTGEPKVDETVLESLPYPEAKQLAEYFLLNKRIGQIAEGDEAWLKRVGPDGRMHGAVNTNGTVTGRMSHSYPNVAQVPAVRSPYGKECRSLFRAGEGKVLVGADADALELRCLAHFMARYDGGAYVQAVVAGKKEEGTDPHSVNCRALGMDPKAVQWNGEKGRDVAKTWFYAFIYGAGVAKLGFIYTGTRDEKAAKAAGSKTRNALIRGLPALGSFVDAVKAAAKARGGYLRGLDGRWLPVRSEHSAPNTLLQSAGAVLMKRALVILDQQLQEEGYEPGKHYEFVANVHDEWQIEADAEVAPRVCALAPEAIRRAGEAYSFRCPLGGDASVGATWADTH